MDAQVERDATVVALDSVCNALARLRQRVSGRIALHMAKIYRPHMPTESSYRQRARERRARQLAADPSDGLRASAAYRAWTEEFHTSGARGRPNATRKLDDVVDTYMRFSLDPWRAAAAAIVRMRYPDVHGFRELVDEELASKQYALDKAREAATLRIAAEARALLCTTATVGVAMRTQRDQLCPLLARLKTLVCDEAGTLADRHIVSVLAAADVRRLVMIGDPAQLSCFTYVRDAPPVSAMQRLINAGMPSMLLTEQYRMPRALCDVVSTCFYDGCVVTSDGRVGVDVAMPVKFVPAPNGRAEIPVGGKAGSIQNREEVRIVVHEVARLRGRYGWAADIAVLTTYGAQRKAVHEALGGTETIHVLTVDSAQGQEWDFVIYSHVATDRRRTGFTANRNRLCVALSRAKRALIAVVHPDVLRAIPVLKSLKAAAFEDSDAMRRVVAAALRDGAGRVAVDAFRVCCVCQDPISRKVGFLECDPPVVHATVHVMCPECANGHVLAELEREGFDGRVRCPCHSAAADRCTAPAFTAVNIARVVPADTFERLNHAVVARHERAVARQLEQQMTEHLDARLAALNLGTGDHAAVDRAVEHVTERILTLRCPSCDAAFVDYNGCAALTCRRGAHFCAFCLAETTHDDAHKHVSRCAANPLLERGLFV